MLNRSASATSLSVISAHKVTMLIFILKSAAIYLLFLCIACLTLLITSAFLDIESIAWTIYDYLHFHYSFYNESYDFNPALADILIIWVIFIPLVFTSLYYALKTFKNRIKK